MYNDLEFLEDSEQKAPEKMNIFSRIGNLIFSPKKLFLFIREKPSLLFPLIIISICALAYQLLLWEQTRKLQLDVTYNTYQKMGVNITPDQLETLVDTSMITAVITAPLSVIASWAVITLIFYAVFRFADCEKGMKKYFSMMAYISIITAVGMVLNGLYVHFMGGSLTTYVTSISSLIDQEATGTFLYGILTNIEVFNIWAYFLYGMGFIYVGGVQKRKSIIITSVLFVLFTLLSAGITSLSSSILGGLM
ncbi:MAG: YIP1 family protein [Clostridiaceae bacterium]|nr:YIP1 family protein [Clostridiaceae bacterium]